MTIATKNSLLHNPLHSIKPPIMLFYRIMVFGNGFALWELVMILPLIKLTNF